MRSRCSEPPSPPRWPPPSRPAPPPGPTGATSRRRRCSTPSSSAGRSCPPRPTVAGSAPSGYFTGTTSPIAAPYPGQPVQGFSAVHRNADGTYLVMSDNGFGTKPNSQDFELRVHRIAPDFATGVTQVVDGGFGLSDPDGHVPWTIWRDGGCAAAADAAGRLRVPGARPGAHRLGLRHRVDADRPRRHVLVRRRVRAVPAAHRRRGPAARGARAHARGGVAAEPDPARRPGAEPRAAPRASRAWRSRRTAARCTRCSRVPWPRTSPPGCPPTCASTRSALGRRGPAYTGDVWRYRLEHPANAIGDFIAVDEDRFLVIERDGGSGPTARFKAVFLDRPRATATATATSTRTCS